MRFALASSLILLTLLASCSGVIAFSGATRTASGSVSIVRLINTNDGTLVTFVTLIDTFGAQDFSFCGNLMNQFPIDATVRVNFTPGTLCNSNVLVVVML